MKIDGETIEMITLPGHEYLYNCQMICSSNGFICLLDYHGPTWISLSAILLLEMLSYFPKVVPMMRAFIWSCFWPPVINEYKVFWLFFMQEANTKAYLVNVRYIHQ